MEGSHSGLLRLLGEQVSPKGDREFKSHTLRSQHFLSRDLFMSNKIDKEKYFAKCTRCGIDTDNPRLINQRCRMMYKNKGRCKGYYRSNLFKS